ncbi:ATP-binding cassette domain-containing protein [Anderseniella sp. Alg231-50]|uniref:ATP-binding cassette domain-containing protein n=1 Tax=Anderseniella sp. Alg231-50 TaxID=1922226 RepID=UPI000D54CF72
MTGAAIQLDAVDFAYPGGEPLHFSTTFEAGSFTGLIGPSGSGKTTLINLIAGFEEPASGSICFDGADAAGTEPADRPVTMVFQDNNLFAHLDVFTNIALGVSASLDLSGDDRNLIATAMEETGLSGLGQRLPRELSGGQRQRVAIARALVRDRPVLLLDEPFAALGPALRRDMLRLVSSIHQQRKMTVILVSHDPADVKFAATHAAFLDAGRVIANRPVDALFSASDIPGLQGYLGT